MKWLARLGLLEIGAALLTFFIGIGSNDYVKNPDGSFYVQRAPVWDWTRFGIVNLVLVGTIIAILVAIFLAMIAFPTEEEGQQLGVTKIDKK